ncbi:MAG: hypothetical protein ACF8OB_14495, partial [Phycisphaeraceae bacterium JB051]
MPSISDNLKTLLQEIASVQQIVLPDFPAEASGFDCMQLAADAGLDRSQVQHAAAELLGLPFLDDLLDHPTSPTFTDQIPIGFARQYTMVGIESRVASKDGQKPKLIIALADIKNLEHVDTVNRILGHHAEIALAPAHIIESAINRAYESQSGKAQQFISNLDQDQVLSEVQKLAGREDLLDVSSREPVIQLVNLVLFEAFKQQASDVHLQPYETSFVARMRIDGV